MRLPFKGIMAATLALSSLAAANAFASDPVTLDGWLSDSQCGADHAAKGPDPACVMKCIKGGAKPVFVDSKNVVWSIDDPEAVKDHYGHHVSVLATVDSEKKAVHITKVTMLADQTGAK